MHFGPFLFLALLFSPVGCLLLARGEVLILIWETPSTEAAGPLHQLGAG
jgi:hypothetical protein